MKQLSATIILLMALLYNGGMQVAAQGCGNPYAQRPVPGPGPGMPPVVCASQFIIRVNVHFVLKSDGTGNFNEQSDGGSAAVQGYTGEAMPPDPAWNGYRVAEELINMANMRNTRNYQMDLPVGNMTPVVPKKLIYLLSGTYFHRNDALYGYDPMNYYGPNGIFDHAQFNAYGANKGSEINIFLMGQNTAANIRTNYGYNYLSGGASGVGFLDAAGQSTDGSNNIWTKMGNLWRVHMLARRDNPAAYDIGGWPWPMDQSGKLLNHELGHLFGLGHPDWPSETCADNPPTIGGGNNTMVSGAADQVALTPCQIERVQTELGTHYLPYIAACNPCMPPRAFFTVPQYFEDCAELSKALPVDGRGSFNETSHSRVFTEVDANNQPIGVGIYTPGSGPAGQFNLGPLPASKRYALTLTVYNSCGSHSVTKYINTACTGKAPSPGRAITMYPNPTTADFTVQYNEDTHALPIVRDGQGRLLPVERAATRYEGGQWHVSYRFRVAAPAGLYLVETGQGSSRTVQPLSIQRF